MIRTVSIIGMGALGLMYGNWIAKEGGADSVSFVMDRERVKKYAGSDFTINGEKRSFNIVSAEDATPADLVIVAVKYTGLESALDVMATSIDEHTMIMSVMNGISSEEIIGNKLIPNSPTMTLSLASDTIPLFKQKINAEEKYRRLFAFARKLEFFPRHESTHAAGIVISAKALDEVAEYFDSIKMPYVIEEDIIWRMWFKYMLNVGINQVCMVFDTTYSGALNEGEANRALIAAMREVKAIANAKGIGISEDDIRKCIEIESTLDPNGIPSMGQDRINKKASEVEMFAGTVIKMGNELGILVPENKYIYEQVMEIEKEYV